MTLSIHAFWQLLQDSRLFAPEQCRQLAADFSQVKGAADSATARTLAEWLVARNVLSKYQMTILLAGRAGPFLYGDYKVYDRVEKGRLEGQFRAVHAATGHPVLLQFLSGPVLTDAGLWAAAERLARAAAAVVSPHVQRWLEPVSVPPYRFVVSEDLRGATAEERLSVGRFSPAEGSRIARQAALGLAQLHQAGRVHGDLRPANLLLETLPGQGPNVKLLWQAFEAPRPLNLADAAPGSRLAAMADYLAPELAAPGYLPDPLTDIYGLGATLYTLLAGVPPFAGGSIEQKLARHATEAIRPLEQFGVPQPLAQLVAFMMAKNPAVRYQSATLVAEQLAAFVEPAALYALPPPPPPTLASFESFLRQRVAMLPPPPPAPLAAPAAAASEFPVLSPRRVVFPAESLGVDSFGSPGAPAAAFEMPAIALGGGPAAGPRFDAMLLAGASAPLPVPPINDLPPGPLPASFGGPVLERPLGGVKATPAALVQQRAARNQRQQLATAAGVVVACVAVAIVSVVVLINLNAFGDKPDGNQVAAVNPQQPKQGEEPEDDGGDPSGVSVTPASVPATADPSTATKSPATDVPPPGSGNPPAAGVIAPAASDGGFQQEIVADDDKLLWASPTTGKPVSFRCVPPEGQVFVIVRPADLLASGEGEKVLQALGPSLAAARGAWEKAAGVGLPEIEQLIITLHNNDAKFPRASFVVTTRETIAPDQLLTRWNNPTAAQEGMATYYTAGPWAYYISSPESERTFVMGEPRDVKEVAKAAGNPPVLFREVERLRRTTDASRHFTVLFYPQFLQNDDGEPLFAAERAKVRQPLVWLLGDGLQAAAVSMHFGEPFYLEMRMLGSLDKEPYLLSAEIKSRLGQVPTAIEDYLVGMTPPPYWKKLSFRFPQMLQQLQGNLRIGVENEQAIVNCVLPGAAAHNLVLGGELLIASAPGSVSAATAGPATTKATPKTLADALQLKTTFSFDQQSLEFALRDLAADAQGQLQGSGVEFGIKIIGGDLEKDGITRNQSVRDFKQENKTLAEILTALVRKANPDPSAKGPNDPAQKLLWLIGPDPDDPAKQVILVTTRTAAETKRYTLPAEFVIKDDGKKGR